MTTTSVSPGHERIGTEWFYRFTVGDAALWTLAFVLVLALGASSTFLASIWRYEPDLPGAPPPAIMIELAPISVAPQVEDIAADPGPQAMEQTASDPVVPIPIPQEMPEPIDPVEPVTEPMVEPDPITPIDQQLAEVLPPAEIVQETAEPVDEVEPQPVEHSVPLEDVQPIQDAEPIDEIVPDLLESETAEVTLPMPVAVPSTIAQKREEFAKKQEQQRKERQRKEQERKQQQAQQVASRQTAPQSVEAEQSQQMAAPQQNNTSRRTPNISPEQWQSQVIAHLNRLKRYPNDAKSRREEGVPYLQFTINPAGQVLTARIVRSSGFASLDQAAIAMINRASPVPAPPPAIAQNRMTLTVPINFNLR